MTRRDPLLTLLRSALARLEAPGRWAQGALARDRAGAPVLDDDPAAASWCPVGALTREAGPRGVPLVRRALRALCEDPALAGYELLASWANEPGRRQRDVVRLFRRTIRRTGP